MGRGGFKGEYMRSMRDRRLRGVLRQLGMITVAAVCAVPARAAGDTVDYPLRVGTNWTYHMHQEATPGAHFSGVLASLAHGNTLDATLNTRVAGTERIGEIIYSRVESTLNGRPYMTEWFRVTADGLYLGKTDDADAGGTVTVITPPQRVLTAALRRGETWSWQASDAPVAASMRVAGPAAIRVPAGLFQATLVETRMSMGAPPQSARVALDRWFVPGIGFVKFQTQTYVAEHRVSHGEITLEGFKPGK